MRPFALLASLAIATLGWSQTPAARQGEIWDAADDQLINYIDYWFKEGDFPRCIQVLRLRYDMFPNDYEAMSDLGWLLESTEQSAEALALYVRYRQMNPSKDDAAYAEAEFYFRKKAWARIPPLIEPEMTKKLPANMYRMLAHSYERLGRLRDSVRIWDMYIALVPGDQAARNNRGRVVRKLEGDTPAR